MKQVGLVLGTMTFGESVFHPDVETLIRTFLDAGHTELDTAYVYNDGACERLLGDVLPGLDRPYRIATKVNPRITGRLDGAAAYAQLNESLARMRRDSADTVYLHFPDPATPVEDVLRAMADLHAQGRFKELGLSNFPAWMVADVWRICERNGYVRPTVYEGIYNPLAGGLLTGRYGAFEEAPEDGRFTHRPNYQKRYWKKSFFDAVEIVKAAAERHGITPTEATYRWLKHHSMLNGARGDAILIGASKLTHLQQNLAAFEQGPLPADLVEAFERAWQVSRPDAPAYFTLYRGKGSVGGEKR